MTKHATAQRWEPVRLYELVVKKIRGEASAAEVKAVELAMTDGRPLGLIKVSRMGDRFIVR